MDIITQYDETAKEHDNAIDSQENGKKFLFY
jgi:hypothetical protein